MPKKERLEAIAKVLEVNPEYSAGEVRIQKMGMKYHSYFFRYSAGDCPVYFLNTREKWLRDEKPR